MPLVMFSSRWIVTSRHCGYCGSHSRAGRRWTGGARPPAAAACTEVNALVLLPICQTRVRRTGRSHRAHRSGAHVDGRGDPAGGRSVPPRRCARPSRGPSGRLEVPAQLLGQAGAVARRGGVVSGAGVADRAAGDGGHRHAAGQEHRHEEPAAPSNGTRGDRCLRHGHHSAHRRSGCTPVPGPAPTLTVSAWSRGRQGPTKTATAPNARHEPHRPARP